MTILAFIGSRLAIGSSASRILGSCASARAIATRLHAGRRSESVSAFCSAVCGHPPAVRAPGSRRRVRAAVNTCASAPPGRQVVSRPCHHSIGDSHVPETADKVETAEKIIAPTPTARRAAPCPSDAQLSLSPNRIWPSEGSISRFSSTQQRGLARAGPPDLMPTIWPSGIYEVGVVDGDLLSPNLRVSLSSFSMDGAPFPADLAQEGYAPM